MKAKLLGIPYMGSKKKYANRLMDKMLCMKPDAKYFYDLFGGGGAMTFAAAQRGLKVFYNEKQKGVVDLHKFIAECSKAPQSEFGIFPRHFYEFVTRKDFLRLKEESGPYAEFVRVIYSFGNRQQNYLFGPQLETLKHAGHNAVVFRCEQSLNRLNDLTGANFAISEKPTINERRLDFLAQAIKFGRLEQLERLGRLERLEGLQSLYDNISFTNLSYEQVEFETPAEETIVYLDPPYRGTEKYKETISYNDLDAYFSSLPFMAFMSEYNAPFDCILEIETRSTFSASSNTTKRVERLYVNRKDWGWPR